MTNLNKSGVHTRRAFLKNSSLLAIGVSVPLLALCKEKVRDPEPISPCRTTDDILGPFYKASAPFGDNIIPEGTSEEPLMIVGKVFSNCNDPIENAIVEIWNADGEGVYDMSDSYFFRGRYQTLSDGQYQFRTIIPGRYLNGSTYRPSHIHFRISAPGHQDLVSQIYFKSDPFIPTDPWASADKAKERILTITTDATGTDIVNFDVHLNKLG